MDMIRYIQKALPIDLAHSKNKEGFTMDLLPANSIWVKLPKILGMGGIVTRPTFAMIGESRPEAVIPLGRNTVFWTESA